MHERPATTATVTPGGRNGDHPVPARPRRRRWIGALVAVSLVAVAAALAAATQLRDSGGEDTEVASEPRSTSTAEVRDLVERESFDATLGYPAIAALTTQLTGVVTVVAEEGDVVRRGEGLFRVGGQPVILMYGDRPAWRTLSTEVDEGRDVLQLERNLAALGHDPDGDMEIDGDFDWATENAVERWQAAVGVEEDGVVDLGEVVLLPGPVRVGTHAVEAGSVVAAGTAIFEATETEPAVTLELEADRRDLAKRGDRVQVELPDGETVQGHIAEVASVATVDEADPEADPVIEVRISLPASVGDAAFDQAPVEVDITTRSERDVLAVPVGALLALAEGGYAVEVVEGTTTRLVAVEPGMYADGYVEIAGDGIEPGVEVVVAG